MQKGEENVTYTKFTVNVNAQNNAKASSRGKTLFFDSSREPTVRHGEHEKSNVHIRSARERRRKSARKMKRALSGIFRCLFFAALTALIAAIPLIMLGIIGIDDGTLHVGAYTFGVGEMSGDFVDFLHDKESLPASSVISSYYLSLPKDDGKNGIELNLPDSEEYNTSADSAVSEDAVAVSAVKGEIGTEEGERFPLTQADLSAENGEVRINNDTSYDVSVNDYLSKEYPIEPIVPFEAPDNPKVLVIHTHGTESFTSSDSDSYPKSELSPRSTDITKNVVGLGKELSDSLNMYGISSVHCEIMHDEKSFLSAYSESSKSIKEYLEKYPTIEYIIDLHRDSIVRSTNEKIKPTAEICGEKTAQIMFVIGTDEGGAAHPEWRKNLTAALKIQKRIADDYPSLLRPLNLRSSRFNQHFAPGAFILEVGSCGNTYEEASRAVKLFAGSFARAVTR